MSRKHRMVSMNLDFIPRKIELSVPIETTCFEVTSNKASSKSFSLHFAVQCSDNPFGEEWTYCKLEILTVKEREEFDWGFWVYHGIVKCKSEVLHVFIKKDTQNQVKLSPWQQLGTELKNINNIKGTGNTPKGETP